MTQRDPSILLLSPDEGTRATFRELLDPLPVRDACTNDEARQAAADHSFDVLILDIESIADLDAIVDACYGGATTPVILAIAPREEGEALLERVEAGTLYRFIFKPFLVGQARLAVDATLTRHANGADPVLDIELPELPDPSGGGRMVLLAGGVTAVAVIAAAGLFLNVYGEDPPEQLAHDGLPATNGAVASLETMPAESPAAPRPGSYRERAPAAAHTDAPASNPLAAAASSANAGSVARPSHDRIVDTVEPDSDVGALAAHAPDSTDALNALAAAEEVPAASSALAGRAGNQDASTERQRNLTMPALDDTLMAEAVVLATNARAESAAIEWPEPPADTDVAAPRTDTSVASTDDSRGGEEIAPGVQPAQGVIADPIDGSVPDTSNTLTLASVSESTPGSTSVAPLAGTDAPGSDALVASTNITTDIVSTPTGQNDEFNLAPLLDDESRSLSQTLAASAMAPTQVPIGAAPPPVTSQSAASLARSDSTAAKTFPGIEPGSFKVGPSADSSDPFYRAADIDSSTLDPLATDNAPDPGVPAPWNDTTSAGSAQPVGVPPGPAAIEPMSAGGNVRDSDELVRTVYAAPEYPRYALKRNMEGWVQVRFTIGPDGIPTGVDVVDSKPRKTFDRAAIRAVRDWRYEPPVENGQYATRDTEVRIQFALD